MCADRGQDKVAYLYNPYQPAVLRSLQRIIGGGSKAAAKAAREAYEMVTGSEYTTPEAAAKWLKENYVVEDNQE